MSGRGKKYNLCWHKPMMHSLKGCTEVLMLWAGHSDITKACIMGTQQEYTPTDTSSPQHPNREGIPRACAEHSVERKFGSFKRNKFWPSEDLHGKSSCASGMCPICVSKNKLKMPLILIPCQDYSSLHTPDFSGLQAAKAISTLTWQRWTLQRSTQARKL